MEKSTKGKFVKKSTYFLMIFSLIFFIIYVLSDRYVPNTDQAEVKGLVLPIAPLINGYVTKVYVSLHSQVKKGDTLFEIDRKPYEIALNISKGNLSLVSQNIEAGISGIKKGEASLNRANVSLERATKTWERVQRVTNLHKGALSESDREKAEAVYLRALEQVVMAEASLEKIKSTLGPTDYSNPNFQIISDQIDKANWDLSNTAITAPSDGVVESFNIEEGHFAAAGRPLVSLVTNNNIWLQANLKENNLTHINIGNTVDITFDIAPGKLYKGKVLSIAKGVSTGFNNPSDLPRVQSQQGWLRDSQRFPVIIEIEGVEIKKLLRQGSQAEIVVYTGRRPILNSLAKFRIWIISKISYVR